jgi:hypothetical protein
MWLGFMTECGMWWDMHLARAFSPHAEGGGRPGAAPQARIARAFSPHFGILQFTFRYFVITGLV